MDLQRHSYASLDIEIRRKDLPHRFSAPYSLGVVRYEQVGGDMLFEVPGVARYALLPSGRILIEASPDAEDARIGFYLESLVFPALAMASGMLLFHGSAVAGPAGGLVLLGSKGAGKSTTAATLALSGCSMLCDDTVPIRTDEPCIAPGIPVPMLLPDAFRRIHGESKSEAKSSPRVRHQKSAGIVPTTRACTPLAAIIILEVRKCGSVQIMKLRGLEKTRHGVPHVLHLPGLFDPVREFSRCMELLRRTDVYTITRPADEDSLDEVTSLILGCARGMDQCRETLSPKLRPDRPSISSTTR